MSAQAFTHRCRGSICPRHMRRTAARDNGGRTNPGPFEPGTDDCHTARTARCGRISGGSRGRTGMDDGDPGGTRSTTAGQPETRWPIRSRTSPSVTPPFATIATPRREVRRWSAVRPSTASSASVGPGSGAAPGSRSTMSAVPDDAANPSGAMRCRTGSGLKSRRVSTVGEPTHWPPAREPLDRRIRTRAADDE